MSIRGRIGFIAASIVGVAAYMGISVWAEGGWKTYCADPARVGLFVVAIGLALIASFANSSGLGAGKKEDRGNRWVIMIFIGIGLVTSWLPAYLDGKNFGRTDGDVLRWIGVALAGIGGVIRLVPVFELGNRFSGLVAIQEGHRLKTDGMYRVIRHPSYLGLLISTFGWILAFGQLWLAIGLIIITTATVIARIHSEERLLQEYFGEEYAAYRAHTWRLIPHVY